MYFHGQTFTAALMCPPAVQEYEHQYVTTALLPSCYRTMGWLDSSAVLSQELCGAHWWQQWHGLCMNRWCQKWAWNPEWLVLFFFCRSLWSAGEMGVANDFPQKDDLYLLWGSTAELSGQEGFPHRNGSGGKHCFGHDGKSIPGRPCHSWSVRSVSDSGVVCGLDPASGKFSSAVLAEKLQKKDMIKTFGREIFTAGTSRRRTLLLSLAAGPVS